MFTGLIKHLGKLVARTGNTIDVECLSLADAINLGDSVAVNGACLTVASLLGNGFRADLLATTRNDTTLGKLTIGTRVNLELAVRAGESLGGHFVQGHIDGTLRLEERRKLTSGDWLLRFELPRWLTPWIIEKGSIAIDGVSLTVQELVADRFGVMLIPTTWDDTALQYVKPGTLVNVEADMLVKTVHSSLSQMLDEGLTEVKLRKWGYHK